MIDLTRALEHVSIGNRGDFHDAARCLLVHRKEDLPLFEEAFAAFWRKPSEGQTSLDLSGASERVKDQIDTWQLRRDALLNGGVALRTRREC